MRICEFTQHDLSVTDEGGGRYYPRTPMEKAMAVLVRALETVNKAGLEGKALSNLRIVDVYDPAKHSDAQVIEIHADVKHRLRTPNPS